MEQRRYRVDLFMIPPIVIAMCAGGALLLLEGMTQRGLLLGLILLPFYYLGAEVLARSVLLDLDGITIHKFLRSVRLDWTQVESLDAVKTGHKLFLILQSESGKPIFITNTLRPFNELAQAVMDSVPADRISEGVRDLLAHAPAKHGPMIQAWIVCVVLTGMVIARLLGYG